MAKTEISWSEYVWNVARGCQRVSPGCGGGAVKGPDGEAGGCYAEAMAARIVRMGGYEWSAVAEQWEANPTKAPTPARASADRYRDLVKLNKDGKARWTGKFTLDTGVLAEPLSWRAPRLVFVNSMSDLFGEGLSNEQIAAVFGVMAACSQHTFQVLTKRAARMADWFRWVERVRANFSTPARHRSDVEIDGEVGAHLHPHTACRELARDINRRADRFDARTWPLPNVWLGVSCERQEEADERIPHLLDCQAAVRWVSAEPLLGPIDFTKIRAFRSPPAPTPIGGEPYLDALRGEGMRPSPMTGVLIETTVDASVDWIVWGGESGHGARPCDADWIRSGVVQCREAGVPAYVKQLGAFSLHRDTAIPQKDKKGADMAEWPADLRVRQWPEGFTPPKSKALPVVEDANA